MGKITFQLKLKCHFCMLYNEVICKSGIQLHDHYYFKFINLDYKNCKEKSSPSLRRLNCNVTISNRAGIQIHT